MLKKPAQQSWEVHAEETAVWQVLENRVCSVRLDYPVPLATASVLNGYIHIFKTYLQQQYHKFFLPLWKWYQILQQRPEIFLAWAWFSCFCLACVKCHFVCICGYHLSQGISSYRIQVVLATGGCMMWTVTRKGYSVWYCSQYYSLEDKLWSRLSLNLSSWVCFDKGSSVIMYDCLQMGKDLGTKPAQACTRWVAWVVVKVVLWVCESGDVGVWGWSCGCVRVFV